MRRADAMATRQCSCRTFCGALTSLNLTRFLKGRGLDVRIGAAHRLASKFFLFRSSDGELRSGEGSGKGSNEGSAAEVGESREDEPERKRSRSGDDAPKTSLPDRQKSDSYENVLTDYENWLLMLTFRAGKDVEKSGSSFIMGTGTKRGANASAKPKPISSKSHHSSDECEPNRKSCLKSALRRSSPKDNRPRFCSFAHLIWSSFLIHLLELVRIDP